MKQKIDDSIISMCYEGFLRRAFGLSKKIKMIEQSSDPASMAYALKVSVDNLSKVKLATGYAMLIYINYIEDGFMEQLNENEYQVMNSFPNRLIEADNYIEIYEIIMDFHDKFEKKVLSIQNY